VKRDNVSSNFRERRKKKRHLGKMIMKTFVSDIIPKIQRFSKKLDDVTLLTNQHWVVIDQLETTKTVYIFRQNGELLISTNGKVNKAKWEYLGHNSILIDIANESYLFKPDIFDENILALKIDSKNEYAILVNESKFNGELNSLDAVHSFLNQNYLINPLTTQNVLKESTINIIDEKFISDKYSLRIGSHKEYLLRFSEGSLVTVFKKSNGKYFIYRENEILLFENKNLLLSYVIRQL
jgi:hypothetical protein